MSLSPGFTKFISASFLLTALLNLNGHKFYHSRPPVAIECPPSVVTDTRDSITWAKSGDGEVTLAEIVPAGTLLMLNPQLSIPGVERWSVSPEQLEIELNKHDCVYSIPPTSRTFSVGSCKDFAESRGKEECDEIGSLDTEGFTFYWLNPGASAAECEVFGERFPYLEIFWDPSHPVPPNRYALPDDCAGIELSPYILGFIPAFDTRRIFFDQFLPILEQQGEESLSRSVCTEATDLIINSSGDDGLSSNAPKGTCTTGHLIEINGQMVLECTFRAAIELVNRDEGLSDFEFEFDIDGTYPSILPERPYESLDYPVVFDASSQRGGGVFISGEKLSGQAAGLKINSSDVVLRALTFSGFQDGVIIEATNVQVDSCQFLSNKITGLSLRGQSNEIKNSVFELNDVGILIDYDLTSLRQPNRIENNRIGFSELSSFGNISDGIRIEVTKKIDDIVSQELLMLITKNAIGNNGENGIHLIETGLVRIAGNLIAQNGSSGLRIDNSQNTIVLDNDIIKNGFEGVLLKMSRDILVSENEITENELDGIRWTSEKSSFNIVLFHNTISGNGLNGISGELSDFKNQISILQNSIGIDLQGQKKSNELFGIHVEKFGGGSLVVDSNVISANKSGGILLEEFGGQLTVSNNIIGLNSSGEVAPNLGPGISIAFNLGTRVHHQINSNLITANLGNAITVTNDRFGQFLSISHNRIGIGRDSSLSEDFRNSGDGLNIKDARKIIINNNLIAQSNVGIRTLSAHVEIQGNKLFNNKIGFWIVFGQNSALYGNLISSRNVAVLDSQVNVILESTNAELYANEIVFGQSPSSGLHLLSSSAFMSGNRLAHDAGDAIFVDPNSSLTIHNSSFEDNAGYAINNQNTSITINATDNWWGDTSGPSGAGPGSGDAVSENVDYSNWKSEAPGLMAAVLGDTIYVPAGDTTTLPVFVQNWKIRDDFVSADVRDEQLWRVRIGDVIFAEQLEDSLPRQFDFDFAVPANPDPAESVATAFATSYTFTGGPPETDTVRFLLIAQQRALEFISLIPDTAFLKPGDTAVFNALGFDQFDEPFEFTPLWQAEGGTIDDSGVFIAGDQSGTFEVLVTNGSGTVMATGIVVVESDVTTAVENEAGSKREFSVRSIFPNPFEKDLVVRLNIENNTNLELILCDVSGREIYRTKKSFQSGQHDWIIRPEVSAHGLFLLQLIGDGFQKVEKVLHWQGGN